MASIGATPPATGMMGVAASSWSSTTLRARSMAAASRRSAFDRTIRLAAPIWSANSSSIGLSWSSSSSAARCASSASRSCATPPSASAGPSTSVTTPSSITCDLISGQLKAWTRGCGSARPDVSMMMWSGGGVCASNCCMLGRKSSATVQQIQPFASSMMSSALQLSAPQSSSIAPSMPISPNSLTISASRRPFAWVMILRISVVLPDPRNPVMTVAGIREEAIGCTFQA